MKKVLLFLAAALVAQGITRAQSPAVVDLEAAATVNAALLTWDYQGGAGTPTGYEVTYSSAGSTTATTVTVTDPYCAIYGLFPRTVYKAYVRVTDSTTGFGAYDSVVFTTGPFATVALDTGTIDGRFIPVSNENYHSYSQQLVTAAEMGGTSTVITGIDFEYGYTEATTIKNNVTIYLTNTSVSTLDSSNAPSFTGGFVPFNPNTFKQVYTGSLNASLGWNHYEFDTVFDYDGTSNLLITVLDNSAAAIGSAYAFKAHNAAGKSRYYGPFSTQPINPASLDASLGTALSYRSNMRIGTVDQVDVYCADPQAAVVDGDSTTAVLMWVPGYYDTSWDVEYRIAGATAWTTVDTGVTTAPYIIYNLVPSTSYEFLVSHQCNGDTYGDEAVFSTPCTQKDIPYTEDFENVGTSMPSCWDFVLTGGSMYQLPIYNPGIGSTHTYTGSHSLGTNGVCRIMLPEMAEPLENLQITFYDYTGGSENGLVVGVMEQGNFTPVDTVSLLPERHNLVNVMFNNYHGSSRTIALQTYTTATNGDERSYHYIDDIVVDHLPTCLPVRNVHTAYVSDDSLVIAWTPNGNESEWIVNYDGNDWTVNTDSIIATGLSPSTHYTFTVRAVCSATDTSTAVSYTTRTACGKLTTLPYIQDFEHETATTALSADFIPCWHVISTFTHPYVYDEVNHTAGGHMSLVWSISSSTDYSIVILPEIDTMAISANVLKLTLWIRSSGAGRELLVGVMSDPDSANSFVAFDTITIVQTTDLQEWIPYTATISSWQGSGSYIAIRANSATASWNAYIDDIVLEEMPSCPSVENVNVIPTPSAAIVTWTPFDNTYTGAVVEYRESTAMTWNSQTVSGVSYLTLTGLTPGTYYELRVTALCGGETGLGVNSIFATPGIPCTGIDSTAIDTVTIGTDNGQTEGIPVYASFGNTLCQSIYLASELTALGAGTTINSVTYTWTNNATFAKQFTIYMTNTHKSEFDGVFADEWVPTSPSTRVYSGFHPIGTSGSVTYILDPPFEWDGTSNICITTTMNQPDSGITHFATSFYGLSTQTSPLAYRSLYRRADYTAIDGSNLTEANPTGRSTSRPNVTLTGGNCQQYDTCATPAAIVTDITTNSVTIVWVPGYAETEWTLSYRHVSSSSFSIVATGVTGNSYTFYGLGSGNEYEFKVANDCGDGHSIIVSATTLCGTIDSLPFFEDFNNWGSGFDIATLTYTIPRCWRSFGNACIYEYSYTIYDTIRYGMSLPVNQNSNTTLILPPFAVNGYHLNQTQLVFNSWYSMDDSPSKFAVGVMTDPTDTNTFVPVDTVQPSTIRTWEALEVPFDTYTGNGVYIAIRTVFNGNSSSYRLDDLTLEPIPYCQRPDRLYATGATPNSVVLGWRDRAGASQWQIEYGPEGFEPGTGTLITVGSNPFTLTGLPSSYRGEYYVRAVCDSGYLGLFSRRSCFFNTRQIPASLPYNYGFEDTAEWANWESVSNHSIDWFRGTAVADSGNNSLYVSADSGATYKPYYYNRNVIAATYRDIDFGNTDSSFILTFRSRAGTAPMYELGGELLFHEGLVVMLVDHNTTPVINSSSNSPWGNIDSLYCLATVRRDTNWTTYEIDIDNISGIHRLAFFWHNGRWGGSPNMIYEPAAVDNLQIHLATCPRPHGLDTIAVTGNTATLTWNDDSSANYQVAYSYAGGIQQTVSTTTNSVTLTGLSPTSRYQAWVRKICAPGDTSHWSTPLEFKTKICDGGFAVDIGAADATVDSTYFAPVNNLHKYSLCETIIDSTELGGPMEITAMAYYFYFNYMPMTWKNDVTIWLQPTDMTQFTDISHIVPIDNSTAVQVFHGVLYCEYGWNYFYFDSVYNYDGHGNLMVIVDDNSGVGYGTLINFKTLSCSGYKTAVFGEFSTDVDPTSTAPFTGDAHRYRWRPAMQLVSCNISCMPPVVSSISTDYQTATINVAGHGSLFELSYGTSVSYQPNVLTSTTGVFNLGGLTHSTTYYYSVRQECDSGDYSLYNQGLFSTDRIECSQIGNLSVDVTYYDGATFSWSAGGNETAWEVMVNNYVTSVTDTVTTTTYTIRGLYSNTQYFVNVRPLCGPNADIAGDWMDSSVLFTTDICQPVSNINYVGRTGTSITLAWDAAAGTDTWRVAYGYPGFSHGEELGTYTTTDNPFMLTGLDTATAYTVQVATLCTEELVSSWSQYDFTTTDGEGIVSVDAEGNIAIFPNPASTKVTLRVGEQWVGSTVSILDLNGREVASFDIHNSQFDIDLSTLRAGAYFVRITGDKSTTVRKLIMQ